MVDCDLTENQKELLRSLVPGLKDGSVATEWLCGELRTFQGSSPYIHEGIPDELKQTYWKDITRSDFDNFEDCEYIKNRGGGRYTVFAQKIINSVENEFDKNSTLQTQKTETITITPIFGPPLATRQFQCDVFMLMPFRDEFRVVYNQHIKAIIESLGLEIKLGDDFFSKHDIIKEIWSAIYNSKFVIADCTGKNANVFYELGIAHMLDKPAIMIAQSDDDVPFDVKAKRYIRYENSPEGLQKFEIELKTAIERLMSELDE